MTPSSADLQALLLSFRLAAVTVLVLLALGAPLAWWLARGNGWWRGAVEALSSLPLVLPPSVLGFYLLLLMGRDGPLAPVARWWGVESFAFTFEGLVLGSVLYSLPFVVGPLVAAFRGVSQQQLDVAATLGASAWDRFVSVVLPLSRDGWIRAAALGFAHTLGEFGVVLMLGGNLPGETRVASIAIYQHVEVLDYSAAHRLSAVLVLVSLGLLLAVQWWTRRRHHGAGQGESNA